MSTFPSIVHVNTLSVPGSTIVCAMLISLHRIPCIYENNSHNYDVFQVYSIIPTAALFHMYIIVTWITNHNISDNPDTLSVVPFHSAKGLRIASFMQSRKYLWFNSITIDRYVLNGMHIAIIHSILSAVQLHSCACFHGDGTFDITSYDTHLHSMNSYYLHISIIQSMFNIWSSTPLQYRLQSGSLNYFISHATRNLQ